MTKQETEELITVGELILELQKYSTTSKVVVINRDAIVEKLSIRCIEYSIIKSSQEEIVLLQV